MNGPRNKFNHQTLVSDAANTQLLALQDLYTHYTLYLGKVGTAGSNLSFARCPHVILPRLVGKKIMVNLR